MCAAARGLSAAAELLVVYVVAKQFVDSRCGCSSWMRRSLHRRWNPLYTRCSLQYSIKSNRNYYFWWTGQSRLLTTASASWEWSRQRNIFSSCQSSSFLPVRKYFPFLCFPLRRHHQSDLVARSRAKALFSSDSMHYLSLPSYPYGPESLICRRV